MASYSRAVELSALFSLALWEEGPLAVSLSNGVRASRQKNPPLLAGIACTASLASNAHRPKRGGRTGFTYRVANRRRDGHRILSS